MSQQAAVADGMYFLGFDGGGSKTECVLTEPEGRVLVRAFAGPSNPLRTGYTRAWFALSEAADMVLKRQKIRAGHVRGLCAGLGGAGRSDVARRVSKFFEQGFPNAQVSVKTDLEIALDAAFAAAEGIILVAGTGSAAIGRDAGGRTARVGGRGPWFSDEGGAFDIGRAGFKAAIRAEEGRGPATALSKEILSWHQVKSWDLLLEHIAKNPDDVFPQTFPLVAKLADRGDAVCTAILSNAAASLAELVACMVNDLGWDGREVPVAKIGGVHGRSPHLDEVLHAKLKAAVPQVRWVPVQVSPAEAAARAAMKHANAKGDAA